VVKSKSGFTLMELLMSLAIMSAVLVLAATAYQMYTDTWRRDLSKIEKSFHQFQLQDLTLNALQAVIPLSVLKEENPGSGWGFYFLGRSEGMTAVTAAPIFSNGYPAVIRLFSEATADGKYQLVYEEAALKDMVLKFAGQTLPFTRRIIIRDGVDQIRFRYFGWPSLSAKLSSNAEETFDMAKDGTQWFDDYDGLSRSYQPDKIEIQFNNEFILVELPVRSTLSLRRGIDEESI